MEADLFHVHAKSFHFGRTTVADSIAAASFPSDSLFASLVYTASRSFTPKIFQKLLDPFIARRPPFLITSAFPRAGETLFFPKPLSTLKAEPDDLGKGSFYKRIKKISWLSEKIFMKVIQGEKFGDLFRNGILIQQGMALISAEEFDQLPAYVKKNNVLWLSVIRPRSVVDRGGAGSTPFFIPEIRFAENCGLWFAVRWLNRESMFETQLMQLLSEVSTTGWGGKRSSGFGNFECNLTEHALVFPDKCTAPSWVSLSRYSPQPEEIPQVLCANSSYKLEKVPGWISPEGKAVERRKTVHLIKEGSVMNSLSNELHGGIVDVQPEYNGKKPVGHPVWRYGFAFPVAFSGETQ